MMAKPIRALELHYPMIQFLIIGNIFFHGFFRLQNSPYFCVFKYARTAVKQKVWTEALWDASASREWDSWAILTLRKTDFKQKTDCFAVSLPFFLSRYL